jgi:hypothetical protein
MLGAGIAPGNVVDEGPYFFGCPSIAGGFQLAGVDYFSKPCGRLMNRTNLIGHIFLPYAENVPKANR